MKPEEIRLVYVASTGRSGSTLLEMLLGSFGDIWTMGEIYVLPWEMEKVGGMCGCGQELSRCDFWRPITLELKSILGVNGHIAKFRDDYSRSRFFRFDELPNVLMERSISDKKALTGFCSANRKLFSAIKRRAAEQRRGEIAYLIDSSKIFYRLFWLLQCESISVRVIHMVKDPRSFVYSKIKRARRPGERIRGAVRMSLRYVIENYLIEKVTRTKSEKEILLLRYEDLAGDPDKKLREIAQWLNVTYDANAVRKFRQTQNHGIAGNIMRHGTNGIDLDERWRGNLGRAIRVLVTLLTYPFARKYAYF